MRPIQTLTAVLALAVSPFVTGAELSIWDAGNKGHSGLVLLRCRGGAGYEFRSLEFRNTRVALAMTFAAAAKAAGSNNQGLEPGTCAEIDRPLTASEPREVRIITQVSVLTAPGPLDTSPAAAERQANLQSIPAYLKTPDHYWEFNAVDTKQGYFDTTHHSYSASSATPRPPLPQETPAAPGTAKWQVRAGISGGIDGRRQQVTVDSDGRLQASSSREELTCSAKVGPDVVQKIEAALARAHAEKWPKSYASRDNPNGCCDQLGASLRVQQGSAIRETLWFSANPVPPEVSSFFETVWATARMCAIPR